MRGWHWIALAAALAAYAGLSHLLMLHAAGRPWAVAALLGPLWLLAAGVAWRRRHGALALACALTLIGLVAVVLRGGAGDVNRLYVAQHAGIHLLLGLSFGATLRRGATPLISALAERVHGGLEPAMRAYTRRVTQAWALYFIGMTLLSLALYAWAPWPAWSLFANLLTPLAALALFVAEYVLRYRWHPEFERASMAQALAAYRGFTRSREASR